jgi:hypothetical protein
MDATTTSSAVDVDVDVEPSPAKRIKLLSVEQDESSLLSMLDSDSLRSVLVRVPAEDHDSLRLTCKTIQAAVDSSQFKRLRNRLEWVETKATLVSPREDYENKFPIDEGSDETADEREHSFLQSYNDLGYTDESYGYTEVEAKIWVDGKLAGSAELTLVPRPRRGRIFHEACDAISSELQTVSVAFCDARGRPRLKCIQQVATDHNNGFLYLNKLELDADYQDSTSTGAQAIRSLLCDTLLHNRWSLVVYIADSKVHFNDDDRCKAKEFMKGHGRDQADTYEDENPVLKDWSAHRLDELAQKDMRQFLRAGFQQAAELAHDYSDIHFVFAVPSFLEGRSVMMSHTEALALPMAIRPAAKPDESLQGVNRELLELMKKQCSKRQYKANLLLSASEQEEKKERIINVTRREQATSREQLQHLEARTRDAVANMQVVLHDADLNEVPLRELGETDAYTRAQLKLLVKERGASVQASNVLHCCAANHTPEYIDLLLEYIPDQEKAKTIINSLDASFQTPLMCAAACGMESGAAKLRTCEKLVDLGADKSITDPAGRSALGCFRMSRRSAFDFVNSVGWDREDKDAATSAELEKLLEPLAGETEADKAITIAIASDDDDDDEFDDEDEFDEDDEDEELE